MKNGLILLLLFALFVKAGVQNNKATDKALSAKIAPHGVWLIRQQNNSISEDKRQDTYGKITQDIY